MENNKESKCIRIGTKKIKMFDRIVQTLMNVMHVPGLRTNFISLGALDSKSCKCIVASGVMKVVGEQ